MSIVQIRSRVPYDSNMYLILGSKAYLVDTGTGLDSPNVITSIKQHLGPLSLSAIILTHCHIDHVGGAAAIASEFGCNVYISDIDMPFITNPSSDTGDVSVSKSFHIPLTAVSAHSVSDLNLDLGEHILRIIDTPGHTAGSICIYDEVTKSLFAGDTVFNPGYGRTDLPTGSLKSMSDSLHLLSNVNIGNLYPGHGPATGDGNKAVAMAIAMMEGSY